MDWIRSSSERDFEDEATAALGLGEQARGRRRDVGRKKPRRSVWDEVSLGCFPASRDAEKAVGAPSLDCRAESRARDSVLETTAT